MPVRAPADPVEEEEKKDAIVGGDPEFAKIFATSTDHRKKTALPKAEDAAEKKRKVQSMKIQKAKNQSVKV